MSDAEKQVLPLDATLSSSRLMAMQSQMTTMKQTANKCKDYKVFILSPSEVNNLRLFTKVDNGKAVIMPTTKGKNAAKNETNSRLLCSSTVNSYTAKVPHNVNNNIVERMEEVQPSSIPHTNKIVQNKSNQKSDLKQHRTKKLPNEVRGIMTSNSNCMDGSSESTTSTGSRYVRLPCNRRIVPMFAKHWTDSSETVGYMRCPNPVCNYISFDFSDMGRHYMCCNGKPSVSEFVCPTCESCLGCEDDLRTHILVTHSEPNNEAEKKFKTEHVDTTGKQITSQVLMRKRAYSKVLSVSWNISLEEKGYVCCLFKNCNFLALSLQEMIQHYCICNGSDSSASIVCPYCYGRVETPEKLQVHIKKSHTIVKLGNQPDDRKIPPNLTRTMTSTTMPVKDPLLRTYASVVSRGRKLSDRVLINQRSVNVGPLPNVGKTCGSLKTVTLPSVNMFVKHQQRSIDETFNITVPNSAHASAEVKSVIPVSVISKNLDEMKNEGERDLQENLTFNSPLSSSTLLKSESAPGISEDSIKIEEQTSLFCETVLLDDNPSSPVENPPIETFVELPSLTSSSPCYTDIDVNYCENNLFRYSIQLKSVEEDECKKPMDSQLHCLYSAYENEEENQIQNDSYLVQPDCLQMNGGSETSMVNIKACRKTYSRNSTISTNRYRKTYSRKYVNRSKDSQIGFKCTESESDNLSEPRLDHLQSLRSHRRSYNRRIIPMFAKYWTDSLKTIGYIRCPIRACNYISLNFTDMNKHYIFCSGKPSVSEFVCPTCESCLGCEDDLRTHIFVTHSEPNNEAEKKFKTEHVNTTGKQNTSQALIRIRAYSKVHKVSWNISLEEKGYVRCFFKNCNFLALSLQEMIQHYRICNGSGSSASTVCPYCYGRVETPEKLQVHIKRSHTIVKLEN